MSDPTIVLLGADGPLFNFTRAYLDLVELETGEKYEVDLVDRWAIHECGFFVRAAKRAGLEPSLLKSRVVKHIEKPDFCFSIPVQPDAVEAVRKLRSMGAELWVVTSPWDSSKTWVHERAQRLRSEFGIDPGHIVNVGKKHRFHGNVFVDDKVSNVVAWQKEWPNEQGILFDMHHNRNEVVSVRRGGWEHVFRIVERRAAL